MTVGGCISVQTFLPWGYLAKLERERKNGNDALFIYNQQINSTNIDTNVSSSFAFGWEKEDALAHERRVEEVREKVRKCLDEPISEIRTVGRIYPELPFSNNFDVLRAIKEIRPQLHIQAFTCVEMCHLAQRTACCMVT